VEQSKKRRCLAKGTVSYNKATGIKDIIAVYCVQFVNAKCADMHPYH